MKKALLFCFILPALTALRAQNTVSIHVCTAFWANGLPVPGSDISIVLGAPGSSSTSAFVEDASCATLTATVPDDFPAGSVLTFMGLKDGDDLNGVTILDLVAISSHLLGFQPLTAPSARLAADVNRSGTLTTVDIVESRRLLLGISPEFTDQDSWLFFPENCSFLNPTSPVNDGCPPILINDPLTFDGQTLRLIGSKTGDVDGDANPDGAFAGASIFDSTLLDIPDVPLLAGVPTTIEIKLGGSFSLTGIHVEFLYNDDILHFDGMEYMPDFDPEAYGIHPGKIIAANINLMQPMAPQQVLMKLRFTANTDVQLSEVFSLNSDILHSLGALGNAFPLGIKIGATLGTSSAVAAPAPAHRPARPQPNPFTEQTTFSLQLDGPETVRLEVFDAGGQRRYLSENRFPAGTQLLSVPQEALASGTVGYYRLQAGNTWGSGKLIKL